MNTLTYTGKLRITTCWCGMTYAIPVELYEHQLHKRDNNLRQSNVYCPLGHTWIISGESALDKVQRQAERLERRLANRDEDLRSERASHAATKGQLTKAKKRAERGVCLHCNRSFVDVARHVASKHPHEVTA